MKNSQNRKERYSFLFVCVRASLYYVHLSIKRRERENTVRIKYKGYISDMYKPKSLKSCLAIKLIIRSENVYF